MLDEFFSVCWLEGIVQEGISLIGESRFTSATWIPLPIEPLAVRIKRLIIRFMDYPDLFVCSCCNVLFFPISLQLAPPPKPGREETLTLQWVNFFLG